MPVLAAEPSLYPEDLLDAPDGASHWTGDWRVLHTKPRQEKSLARELLRKGVGFFLPLTQHRWDLRGRVMVSHVPLFPGYLFLWGDHNAHQDALATKRVARSLDVPDQNRLWDDLTSLQRLLTSGLVVAPEEQFIPGQAVEIMRGPLTGFRGFVIRAASGNRFVVRVDFIQRGASVLCDGMALRPLPD